MVNYSKTVFGQQASFVSCEVDFVEVRSPVRIVLDATKCESRRAGDGILCVKRGFREECPESAGIPQKNYEHPVWNTLFCIADTSFRMAAVQELRGEC